MVYCHKTDPNVRVLDEHGDVMAHAVAACPEEGWLDLFVIVPGSQKPMRVVIDRSTGMARKVRVGANFDLIDGRSKTLLHRVRWTKSGTPALKWENRLC